MRYLLCLFIFLTTTYESFAQRSDLLIAPTRLVFNTGDRVKTVELLNRGDAEGTYRISLQNKRMLANGSFQDVAKEDITDSDMFADEFVRFSPRQVTLKPGEKQKVRIFIRRKPEMKKGEYRTHMLFVNIPDESAGTTLASITDPTSNVKINIPLALGISIPVILRENSLDATAAISDIFIQKNGKQHAAVFQLHREGARSIYGDATVTWHAQNGQKHKIAMVKGIALYTPNKNRRVALPAILPKGFASGQGKLVVTFTENDTNAESVTGSAVALVK